MTLQKSSSPSSSPECECGPRLDDSRHGDFFRISLEEKPIWTAIYEALRDAAFPRRLAPLELTSTSVAVPDRLATKANPWAVGSSAAINGAIVAVIVWLALRSGSIPPHWPHAPGVAQPDGLSLLTARAVQLEHGGGGGENSLADPSQGRPPKFEVMPLAPPMAPVIANPILAVDPAIVAEVRLPEDESMPNVGVHKSISVLPDSNGPGNVVGIGIGGRDGVGPGNGPGYGPGADGGIFVPGVGGVTAPVPLVTPDAEFSDEARRQKYQGVCTLSVIVDAQGLVKDVRVVSPLGMGLDEKAREAVWKYRFRPAMRNGKPVPVLITVRVDFRLY
jgi:TonB family protein